MSTRDLRNWCTSPLLACLAVLALLHSFTLPAQSTPATPPATPPSTTDGALPQPAKPGLPSLILVGDSTVRNGRGDGAGGQWGWGEPLAAFFDTSKINVVNRALGGRSSRTYITEGHWASTLALLKPGDVVLIQFGHNDSGPLDDTERARGTLPGIGDEIRDISNPITGQHELVHTYGWYLRQYVVETIARGATPILCSPIPRKLWKDGKVVRNRSDYGGWARSIATEQRIGFLDLNEIIAREYDAMGQSKVEPLFADPHTHTTQAGAELNAQAVVAALKGLPIDPLVGYYSAKAASIQPFRESPPPPMPTP